MANKTTLQAEPGKHDATLTREFDAPRDLVFNAICDANAIPEWWGEHCEVEKFDARTGGSWSIVARPEQGWEQRFHGVYHDVTSPERIVRTFEMTPGKTALETYTFEDVGGRTRMTLQNLYQSVADRDMVAQYGLEKYAGEAHDRLEAYLEKELATA